ncbi:MAG: excinuclease ABC subunit UvrC [Alphaproteobacteria bacterium]|nr:excinuclease ABC subunit UvrC [Alphaproteobacteria bacterium]
MRAYSVVMSETQPASPNEVDNEEPQIKGASLILQKVATLPDAPGVYRMIDAKGVVLYVGKAKNLRSRVRAYTKARGHGNRILRMIDSTCDMEFIRTKTETDALLLEANLIKKLKPRFNVLLRDDKSFPYILLRTDHDVPRLIKHRGAQKIEGNYFGPFASAGAVNRTLNTLQRAFLLRSCTDHVYANRSRPCLLYQIKRCSAPCTGEIDEAGYDNLVNSAKRFLQGDSRAIQDELVAKMETASANQDYEGAAAARDRISALTYVQQKDGINAASLTEADIITIAHEGRQSCVQVFFFRAGQNLGNRAYFPRHDAEQSAAEVLEAFIGQFYDNRPTPKHIYVNETLAGCDLLQEALSLRMEKPITIHRPQRGDKLEALKHATHNAREALARRIAESDNQRRLLQEVANTFNLAAPPARIEVFDNSHLQGTNQIGSMIVAGEEGFMKTQYRKFNIKDETINGDDYAMMQEVFMRRYGRLLKEPEAPRPDLILIDGGRGQLSVTMKVMAELGIDIPMVGIAKGEDRNAGREQFYVSPTGKIEAPFTLPHNAPVLYYLQRLRDEAHRFAIGTHRARRKKDMTKNPLDNIEGIGASRKRALLHHFGSGQAASRASLNELEKVEGISTKIAGRIYDHFTDRKR